MEKYNFYIQRYPTESEPNPPRIDIEEHFHCLYKEFKGITEKGEIKNVVYEDYAEMDGSRVYIPEQPKHKTTEVQLTLYFNRLTALNDSLDFANYIEGRKIEWYDTFRKVYVTLIMTKPPSVGAEKLHGGKRYRRVTFTFTNVYGTYFTRTQI